MPVVGRRHRRAEDGSLPDDDEGNRDSSEYCR